MSLVCYICGTLEFTGFSLLLFKIKVSFCSGVCCLLGQGQCLVLPAALQRAGQKGQGCVQLWLVLLSWKLEVCCVEKVGAWGMEAQHGSGEAFLDKPGASRQDAWMCGWWQTVVWAGFCLKLPSHWM